MKKWMLPALLMMAEKIASASPVCDGLIAAIDDNLRTVAFYGESSIGEAASVERSRESNRDSATAKMMGNIGLMQQNKCAPLKAIPDSRVYFANAFACRRALDWPGADRKIYPSECDQDKWVKSK